MFPVKYNLTLAVIAIATLPLQAIGRDVSVSVQRSMPGDKGQYTIVNHVRQLNMVTTRHIRLGPMGDDYTISEIDCAKRTLRRLGTSEESFAAIKRHPTNWTEPIPGSSASDLLRTACAM